MAMKGAMKLGGAAAAGVGIATVAGDPDSLGAQLMRLKMEQALGVGRWPAQSTPGRSTLRPRHLCICTSRVAGGWSPRRRSWRGLKVEEVQKGMH